MPALSNILNIRRLFFPSAEEGARRRQTAFGTTRKAPAIIAGLAAGTAVYSLGRGIRPISTSAPSAVAGRAVTDAGKTGFLANARGLYERTLGNPLAGGGTRGFLGRILGRFAGGTALAYGTAFSESAITGEPISISGERLTKGALGFALGGPVGFLAGTALGLGKEAVERIQQVPLPNVPSVNIPELPTSTGMSYPDFAYVPQIPQLPSAGFGSVSATYGTTVSPSVNLSGGGFGGLDYSTLLALGALLGLGGYALGRRKRRKKKKRKK